MGTYTVCVTEEPSRPEGLRYSEPEQVEALDAFGAAGRYDRSRLAQLYGGQRVTVVRGWREDGDRFESVTLLTPYPDATLTRLNHGTMIIAFTMNRRAR